MGRCVTEEKQLQLAYPLLVPLHIFGELYTFEGKQVIVEMLLVYRGVV